MKQRIKDTVNIGKVRTIVDIYKEFSAPKIILSPTNKLVGFYNCVSHNKLRKTKSGLPHKISPEKGVRNKLK